MKLLICVVFCLSVTLVSVVHAETINVAVRTDARPLAWRDDFGNYRGYLWKVCLEAATRAGFQVNPVPILSSDREPIFDNREAQYDVVCDPITMTVDRLTRLQATEYRSSPIVFVASSTYAIRTIEKPSEDQSPQSNSLGWFGNISWKIQIWPDFRGPVEIWAAVAGTTSNPPGSRHKASEEESKRIIPRSYTDHKSLASAFCAGTVDRYYGDIEIVRAAVEQAGCGAAFPENPDDMAYEPYMILISNRNDLSAKVTSGIYSMFSDDTIRHVLEAEFSSANISPALRSLLAINRIPSGTVAQSQDRQVTSGRQPLE